MCIPDNWVTIALDYAVATSVSHVWQSSLPYILADTIQLRRPNFIWMYKYVATVLLS